MKKLIPALLLVCMLPAHAHQVIGIADGDTLTLLVDRAPLKIRLADIDAPEKKQAFGQRSKQSLSDLCWGKDARYQAQTIDKYVRTVARVTCAGIDANRSQVERGMAWVYPKYNRDASLPAVENAARAARRGLWADKEPMPPWEFRHPVVTHVADGFGCVTGPRGGRYQLVDGRKRYGC
ncbi:thermonuclease family protein [Undibacterium arcticum]|uniref:Thermonuclease family protein n=2 Tax=Undibacterium arcticum TaxID=1762892 RepID=A0ABV7F0L9_9BURK